MGAEERGRGRGPLSGWDCVWQKALRADESSRAELKEEVGREDRVRYQGPPHPRGDGAEEATRPGPGALTGRHSWGPWRLCRTGPQRPVPEGAGGTLGLEEQGRACLCLGWFSHPGSHSAVRLPCCV